MFRNIVIIASIPLMVLGLATLLALSTSTPASGQTFTVQNNGNSGAGSLRQAILDANFSEGLDKITFNPAAFPPGSPATISPITGLPASTDREGLTIDGTGAGVIIDGSGLASGEDGLAFHTAAGVDLTGVTVISVTVQAFPGDGIQVCGGDPAACDDDVSDSTLSDVTVNDNGDEGVEVVGATVSAILLEDCVVNGNTENGVTVNGKAGNFQSQIENCTTSNNGSRGVNFHSSQIDQMLVGATIVDVVANGNGNRGINLNASGDNIESMVADSIANGNGLAGININAGDSTIDPVITGSTAMGNSSSGLVLNGGAPSSGATVTGNESSGNTGNGISTDTAGTYSSNILNNNGGDGFEARELGITVENSTISGNTEHAVDGNNGGEMTITGNTITGNMSIASALRLPGIDNVIADNTITDNAGDGIDNGFGGAGASTITGNTLLDNGGDGIAGGSDGGHTITGNLVSGNGGDGIRAPGPDNTISGNSAVDNADEGIQVSDADAEVHFNRLFGNATGLLNGGGGTLDAEHNWWGCNEGPPALDCDGVVGDVDFDPWLVLEVFADPSETVPFANSAAFASVTGTSSGGGSSAAPDHILDGTPIEFESDLGDLSGNPVVRFTVNGVAETPFVSDQVGVANIQATLDNQTVSTTIDVVEGSPPASPTPTGTGGPTPTPSATPTPSPSGTPGPGPERLQGDVDCDGDVDAVDALKILQFVAVLPFAQEPGCPQIGEPFSDQLFGDVDCDGDVDAVDALKILQFVAGLPFEQMEPCADIGTALA